MEKKRLPAEAARRCLNTSNPCRSTDTALIAHLEEKTCEPNQNDDAKFSKVLHLLRRVGVSS